MRFYKRVDKIQIKGGDPLHLHTDLSVSLGKDLLQIPNSAIGFYTTWDVKRHCNAQWEFHFIKKGACRVYVDQKPYQLQAGQAVLIEPGRYHQAKAASDIFERFTLGFTLTSGGISKQLSEKTAQSPVFSPTEEILDTTEKLMAEINGTSPYNDTYSRALICCLVIQLLRLLDIKDPNQKPAELPADTLLTQTIDTYFEQHFADSCGEMELAHQLHFSRRHLVRILKKHYNMSFREKLVSTRMDYAAFLLRNTARTVSSIATDVGYSSESAFFKVFQRTFSMTPREYRANQKEQ